MTENVFYLRHLKEHERMNPVLEFEVQVLDSFGDVLDYEYFGKNDDEVFLAEEGVNVPSVVLERAKALDENGSACVNENGDPAMPGDDSLSRSRVDNFYYVVHLDESESWPGQKPGQVYQIQLINDSGQGIAEGFISEVETELVIEGVLIPSQVVEAAKKMPQNTGDYVDGNGKSVEVGQW